MGFKDAYESNHTDFKIDGIEYEEDASSKPSPIEFEYTAPGVSVDTSGRFVTHEIIGGTTVRQKIGEDPVEVDVSGVCKESVARKIDNLRDAKNATIYSKRLPGESLTVQVASTSTSPLDDAGAVGLEASQGSPEFLYTYNISFTEVEV